MKTKDDRKNFTTRKGFIFNLPDDYDLDESDGDLFGIMKFLMIFLMIKNHSLCNQAAQNAYPMSLIFHEICLVLVEWSCSCWTVTNINKWCIGEWFHERR